MRQNRDGHFPATERLAEFCAELRYEALPEAVRRQMATVLVDFFRVGLVGRETPWSMKLRRALSELGGRPVSSVLYSNERTDPVRAAYLNGVIAGSLDWDDTHVGSMLHPGVVVWPAVLAVGETTRSSGKELVAAAVAGYETMIRIGLAVQPGHFRRGFQSTATCGVFGAAAAAGKVLGLDAHGLRDALGLAASYAGGITQFYLSGSEVKRLHAGKASAGGVEAALLAHAGLTGPPDAIEGEQGFARALGDGLDPSYIEDGLGERYHILGLQMKPHAVSARVLAAIEAAEALAAEGVEAGDITAVEIGVPKVIMGRLTGNDPHSLQQAQMSSPFAVAMALVLSTRRPPPLVLGITECESALEDETIRTLSRRTTCVLDEEIEAGTTAEYVPARVTLTLRDGRRLERTVMEPLGCPKRPMTFEDIAQRFQAAAAPLLPGAILQTWLDKARSPETIAGAADLMSLHVSGSG